MKKAVTLLSILFVLFALSCKDNDVKLYGTVIFGANYHAVNCITNVDVFIDGKHIGQLEDPVDSLVDCDSNYGLKTELAIGNHKYKVEIRPISGTGCTKDVSGELNITEGCCETVFINFYEIFAN